MTQNLFLENYESIFTIKNTKKYQEKKITDFSQVGIKAIGKYKLEIELEESMLYFPSMLANPSAFPVRIDIIEKFEALDRTRQYRYSWRLQA